MKKIFFGAALFLIQTLFIVAQSQTGHTISGKLLDKVTKEPISLANIRILQQSDSTFVTGKASANDGQFSIPVNKGSYIIHISFIGYNDFYRNVEIGTSTSRLILGDIFMSSDDILLSETVITAKAPEIVVRGDTIEFNADSYKVTESAVVEDLLKKMPGVEVDKEGNITVNGKAITKILVDGEEFFSDDPKVASKNLPAKMVNKLQVLERQTEMAKMTGFDDGEEENVINLLVRPGMKQGFFGNGFAGYGSKDRYEANAMGNYMKDSNQYTFIVGTNNTNNTGFTDLGTAMFGSMGGGGGRGRGMFGNRDGITISSNIGTNFSKQFSSNFKLGGNVRFGQTNNNVESNRFTQNILSSGNTLESEDDITNNKSRNFNLDLRLEWEPDTLTKIIFRPNAAIYNNSRSEIGDYKTTVEQSGEVKNYGESNYFSNGDGNTLGATLDVSRTIGKPGRVLSAQLSGNMNNSENRGTTVSTTIYSDLHHKNDTIDQRFTNSNESSSWRGYLSYVEPLGRDNFIQLAYQYRQNLSESDKDTRIESEPGSGNYTLLDTLYSKRLENVFVRQELELNFRAVRNDYDYMVGFSMQPSSSLSKTYIGDNLEYNLRQDVINYAPSAQFNYRWSRTKNLRIRYFGSTDQPSVTQLSPVIDISDPLNMNFGNPGLKPSFQHRVNMRYQYSNPEKASAFNMFANAGYMTNDVVALTATNIETGRKVTTYENISGNWNATGRMMFNIPLKNIKFSLFSMSFASYNHANGFTGTYEQIDENISLDNIIITPEKNLSRRVNLGEVLGLNYRSDQFDFSIRGNINHNSVTNSLEGQQNQKYLNYGGSAATTVYLPWDISVESDINYSSNSGYSDGYEQNEWLWNASFQKSLFKQKNGTIRFKIYDILQQRSNITRSVTSNYIRDTTTNTLTSYFMVHFVYRFNIFKGGITQEDMMPQRGSGRGPGQGRGPGGGGGDGFGD